jgi:hypothetical protein
LIVTGTPSGAGAAFTSLAKQLGAQGDKISQLAFGFELDLQVGDIVIQGVIQLAQQDRVHDLSDRLGRSPDSLIHAHIEHDHMRGDAHIDKLDQIFVLFYQAAGIRWILRPHLFNEQLPGRRAQQSLVGQDMPQVLGKG